MADGVQNGTGGTRNKRWWEQRTALQLAAATSLVSLMLVLAFSNMWPFDETPPQVGDKPSIWEVLLHDRLTLGFLRAGIAVVITYAIASVPALVVGGRWMKGLSTAGLTADDADTADSAIEDLQRELRETQAELQDQVTQNDLATQLLLEMHSDVSDTGPEQEGDA